MIGRGLCFGTCGELVQGLYKNREVMCSYKIAKESETLVVDNEFFSNRGKINIGEKKTNLLFEDKALENLSYEKLYKADKNNEKSFQAAEIYMKNYNQLDNDISIYRRTNIARGKGMSSSSADIFSTLRALAKYYSLNEDKDLMMKIATSIEPSDPVHLANSVISDCKTGEILKVFDDGSVFKNVKILLLEPEQKIETKFIKENPSYMDMRMMEKTRMEEAFLMVEEAFDSKDPKLLASAAIQSSLANELIVKKPGLEEIIKLSLKSGAYGLNIGHTGTVIGILLPKDMDEKALIKSLKDYRIDSYYKIYRQEIILEP